MKSIVIDNNDKSCLLCGRTYPLHKHHMVHGTANRNVAERTGLWCWLCPYCHMEVHGNRELDMKLIRKAQEAFEETHSRDEFRQLFGKSYL